MKQIIATTVLILSLITSIQAQESILLGWVEQGNVYHSKVPDNSDYFDFEEGYCSFHEKNISIAVKIRPRQKLTKIEFIVDSVDYISNSPVDNSIIFYLKKENQISPYKGILKFDNKIWQFDIYTNKNIFSFKGDII